MKHHLELKIQAWLDGELSERETRRMEQWMAQDAEAAALAGEIRQVKAALAEGEPTLTLPETRDFYWSKIERQIQRAEHAPAETRSGWRWQRWVVPITAFSALVCALVVMRQESVQPSFDEISSTNDAMEAVTFHDQSASMTVVWLQDSSKVAQAVPHAQPTPKLYPDPGESEVDVE